MKQLEVQIMGQSYLLGCPENGDARLLEAVSKVDAAMCKIRDAGKVKARDRIAVLAALNLAFDVPEPTFLEPALTAATEFAPVQGVAQSKLTMLLKRLDDVLSLDARLP
jgi:cell division protein ZapA